MRKHLGRHNGKFVLSGGLPGKLDRGGALALELAAPQRMPAGVGEGQSGLRGRAVGVPIRVVNLTRALEIE